MFIQTKVLGGLSVEIKFDYLVEDGQIEVTSWKIITVANRPAGNAKWLERRISCDERDRIESECAAAYFANFHD